MANVFRNDFSDGEKVEYEVSATVTSGVPITLGTSGRVGVPLTDGVSGDIVTVKINGVVELAKASGTFTAGTPVDWSNSGGELVATGGDIVDGFVPLRDYATGATTALVLISG